MSISVSCQYWYQARKIRDTVLSACSTRKHAPFSASVKASLGSPKNPAMFDRARLGNLSILSLSLRHSSFFPPYGVTCYIHLGRVSNIAYACPQSPRFWSRDLPHSYDLSERHLVVILLKKAMLGPTGILFASSLTHSSSSSDSKS